MIPPAEPCTQHQLAKPLKFRQINNQILTNLFLFYKL